MLPFIQPPELKNELISQFSTARLSVPTIPCRLSLLVRKFLVKGLPLPIGSATGDWLCQSLSSPIPELSAWTQHLRDILDSHDIKPSSIIQFSCPPEKYSAKWIKLHLGWTAFPYRQLLSCYSCTRLCSCLS